MLVVFNGLAHTAVTRQVRVRFLPNTNGAVTQLDQSNRLLTYKLEVQVFSASHEYVLALSRIVE